MKDKFYLAVDYNNIECLYQSEPVGNNGEIFRYDNHCQLEDGTIESIIGHPMTSDDKPIEVTIQIKKINNHAKRKS